MTDNDIKSNLEWLKTVGDRIHSVTIGKEFIPTVIDYINRLEAENERLLQKTQRPPDVDPMDFCGVLCDFAEGLIKKAKAKAYKEFAERLKEKSKFNIGLIYGKVIYFEDIDNLLKEMVGEDNA